MNRKEYEKIVEFENTINNSVFEVILGTLVEYINEKYKVPIVRCEITHEMLKEMKWQRDKMHEMIEPDLDRITEECRGW